MKIDSSSSCYTSRSISRNCASNLRCVASLPSRQRVLQQHHNAAARPHSTACASPAAAAPVHLLRPQRRAVAARSSSSGGVPPTAFSYESQRLVRVLATRQAVKTLLNYLSEVNGEQHLWLHNYCADHPIPLGGATDPDEWLAQLATSPLTRVADPRRSSVPSAAAKAAALGGGREVSPRDVAERIMELREHIAREMAEGLGRMGEANGAVRRRALSLTVTEFKPPRL